MWRVPAILVKPFRQLLTDLVSSMLRRRDCIGFWWCARCQASQSPHQNSATSEEKPPRRGPEPCRRCNMAGQSLRPSQVVQAAGSGLGFRVRSHFGSSYFGSSAILVTRPERAQPVYSSAERGSLYCHGRSETEAGIRVGLRAAACEEDGTHRC